jgi:hypothetical protein
MIVSACMDFTQRIGGGCEVLYLFVKDRSGDWAIAQLNRVEIEEFSDLSK